jgi:tetratricopeptide (TPR) repeat protein
VIFHRAVVGVLAVALISTVWARSQDQGQPSSIEDSMTRLGSLPLDAGKQSQLQSAIQEHNYSEAESLLAAEAKRDPKSQPLLLLLANLLFLDGKQLNAVLVLKKAELLAPLDERSRFLLALSYIALGEKNLAIPELEQLASANPTKAVYPYWLSRLMYRKMDLERAVVYAQKAVRLDPGFAKGYDQLGLCYAGLNQNEAAIRAYKDSIRLSNEQSMHWPWPSMNLGTLYLRLDRLDEAEAALRSSIAVEPQFPVAHFRLGQVLEKKGNLAAASQELTEAARLDPTYPEPHYVLARIARLQRDEKLAEQELQLFKDLRATDKQKGITRPD